MRKLFLIWVAIMFLSACMPSQFAPPNPTFTYDATTDILETELPGIFGAGSKIKGPLTTEEIESEELAAISRCDTCPQVPFGYMNEAWEGFKAMVQNGDVIVYFLSDTESWQHEYGREGYALIRGNKLITIIITTLN